jgi:hypothetical protein
MKKLNIQKYIQFKKAKCKENLYKKLIGYLENDYKFGKIPKGIE